VKIGYITSVGKIYRNNINFFKKIDKAIKENRYNTKDLNIKSKIKEEIN